MSEGHIPVEEWETIVSNVPIVSVDLVVKVNDGVLLGKRENQPAKGEWFVPGGRIQKHERLHEAAHRVAQEELNVTIEILEYLGAYEHLYDTSEVVNSEGKHYIANGFVVSVNDADFSLDDQHNQAKVFAPDQLPDGLHPYVRSYLVDAGLIPGDA